MVDLPCFRTGRTIEVNLLDGSIGATVLELNRKHYRFPTIVINVVRAICFHKHELVLFRMLVVELTQP